ncbi:MAG TPA: DUF3208 domain-containing protein [Trueperaceae bacterium]|nr:DUF3208 domain-containing protein [Trueperaceae bacterium]
MSDERPDARPDQRRAVRLLQGYLWHPREQEVALADFLPSKLAHDIHVLVDAIPAAPFTFFDDGTLSATQQFYQLTVLTYVDPGEDASGRVPWVAETLQKRLESTPEGVGWQVFEDLRELG